MVNGIYVIYITWIFSVDYAGWPRTKAYPLAEWASVAAKVKESVYTYYAVGVGGLIANELRNKFLKMILK